MAYQRSWDESSPPGTLPADQIDTAIQNDKIATRERLEQVIPGFGDDGVDPKRVRALYQGNTASRPTVTFGGVIYVNIEEGKVQYSDNNGDWVDWPRWSVATGLLDDRPNPPDEINTFYYATDTKELFLSIEGEPDPTWTKIPLGATLARGLKNELPTEPATDLYWSTDTDELFIREGTAWTLVNSTAGIGDIEKSADYYPNNVPGSKVLNIQQARRIELIIREYTPPDPYDSFVIDIPVADIEALGISIDEIVGVTAGNYGIKWTLEPFVDTVFVWAVSAQLYNTTGVPSIYEPPFDTIRIVGVETSDADITNIEHTFQIVVGIIYVPAEEEESE